MASATLTTAPSSSTTIASAFALTTTFTAPPQCSQSEGGLTMLENDAFRIWLNAPIPVTGTTITSCYPSQFISSFLLQTGGVTQAPFSPLVCPQGYATQGPFTSNYIACCPSGWDGLALASSAPPDRPAFGGTCFSNIYNVPIRITSYDNTAIQGSSIFTATGTADQAFAYPYEGFALGVAVLASITPTSSTASPTAITSPNSPTPVQDAKQSSNMGAIAGAVVASILAAVFLTALIAFALNYRKKRMVPSSARSPNRNIYRQYAAHIRLDNDSPTPMVYLGRPPKVLATWQNERRDKGIDIDVDQLPRYENESVYEKPEMPVEQDEAAVPDDPKLYESEDGGHRGEVMVQTFLAELEADQEREMRERDEMDAGEAMMMATVERMKSKKLPALPKRKVAVEEVGDAEQAVTTEEADVEDMKADNVEVMGDAKVHNVD